MNDSSVRKSSTRFFTLCLLAAALVLPGSPVRAHDEDRGTLEAFLHELEAAGDLTEDQHRTIEQLYWEVGLHDQVSAYLGAQTQAGRMCKETAGYVGALLHLEEVGSVLAPAPASYAGGGNVVLLGRVDPQPPNPCYSDNTSTGQLYSGIWGHAVGTREYALQTHSTGLHILDVTDPATA